MTSLMCTKKNKLPTQNSVSIGMSFPQKWRNKEFLIKQNMGRVYHYQTYCTKKNVKSSSGRTIWYQLETWIYTKKLTVLEMK